MKPSELIFEQEEKVFYGGAKQIIKYINQDCVISYYKSKLGNVVIIKTKKTYMAFYCVKDNLQEYGYYQKYRNSRISLKQAVNIIKDGGVILDKKDFQKVKRVILLNNLK